jgi:acetyl-CoA acetyltransferase
MPATIRGAAAVVGVGQTPMYRRGTAPVGERGLVLEAVMQACEQAGIDPRDVDGVASYGSDRNAGPRLMPGLGMRELRWSSMVWEGGGGGIAAALGMAASAIVAGQAEIVAFVRGLAERDGGRLRDDVSRGHISLQYAVNGVRSPAQICALRTQRMLAEGVPASTLYAVAAASYHHARTNPHAFGRNVEFDADVYASSRWVSEPLHLFDCSRENDGAVALIVTSAQRAPDHADRPAYVLSAPHGIGAAFGGEIEESVEPYWSAGFESVARRLWAEAGYGPGDVDVVQVYENFTGPAVASIIDHGFCTLQTAGDFITYENLIVEGGTLPINTAGGNLAEGFIHGMAGAAEAARQILGGSPNPVSGASLSLLAGGPGAPLVSSALFGSAETL